MVTRRNVVLLVDEAHRSQDLYKQFLPRMAKPVNPQAAKDVVDALLRMHKITL